MGKSVLRAGADFMTDVINGKPIDEAAIAGLTAIIEGCGKNNKRDSTAGNPSFPKNCKRVKKTFYYNDRRINKCPKPISNISYDSNVYCLRNMG